VIGDLGLLGSNRQSRRHQSLTSPPSQSSVTRLVRRTRQRERAGLRVEPKLPQHQRQAGPRSGMAQPFAASGREVDIVGRPPYHQPAEPPHFAEKSMSGWRRIQPNSPVGSWDGWRCPAPCGGRSSRSPASLPASARRSVRPARGHRRAGGSVVVARRFRSNAIWPPLCPRPRETDSNSCSTLVSRPFSKRPRTSVVVDPPSAWALEYVR
jgi:hypothetical protein